MSNQLLPCPFCGGPAEQEEARINDEWAVSHIRCKKRCAVQPSAEGSCALFYWSSLQKENVRTCSDDKAKLEATEKAYANWNRRAAQPAAGEPEQQTAINADDLPTKKYPLGAFDLDAPVAAGEPTTSAKQLAAALKFVSCFERQGQAPEWEFEVPGSFNRHVVASSEQVARAKVAQDVRREAPPAAAHGDDPEQWTDQQVRSFLATALRHVDVKGTLHCQDIRDGFKVMRAQAGEGGE